LTADLLLLSGGISVGKYDYVARVLAELGAEFYFQGVALRPGKPLAFGRAREKLFFALPGNPVSTYVTFKLMAGPAVAVLGGASFAPAVFLRARLGEPCTQRGDLSVFLPARLEQQARDPVVTPVKWQGSGDLVALARANCFVVLHPHEAHLNSGEWVDVLRKE
jgi:molybdopterin molybdotransferase